MFAMPHYIIDMTFNLTVAGEEWATTIRDLVEGVKQMNPCNRTEEWTREGDRYLRIISHRMADNMPSLYRILADTYDPYINKPPAVVQIAIRDARFHALDGLPPHLRRSRGAAPPP